MGRGSRPGNPVPNRLSSAPDDRNRFGYRGTRVRVRHWLFLSRFIRRRPVCCIPVGILDVDVRPGACRLDMDTVYILGTHLGDFVPAGRPQGHQGRSSAGSATGADDHRRWRLGTARRPSPARPERRHDDPDRPRPRHRHKWPRVSSADLDRGGNQVRSGALPRMASGSYGCTHASQRVSALGDHG